MLKRRRPRVVWIVRVWWVLQVCASGERAGRKDTRDLYL